MRDHGSATVMNAHPELVIFDLAGTTVRDDGAIVAAFKFALSQFGSTAAAT